jgi:hypothetical protein
MEGSLIEPGQAAEALNAPAVPAKPDLRPAKLMLMEHPQSSWLLRGATVRLVQTAVADMKRLTVGSRRQSTK